jgi:transcriptional regulator with PAS, ATPase and Fis domain
MNDISHICFSECSGMNRIRTIIDEIAGTDINILIKGESGTGKGLVAQAIHMKSPRRGKPFIKVNCAAIPHSLLESELFGFEKGAFTGAHLKKPGKFELANGGTILLNEIGEIDISIQAKLLQVLQDGGFSRLGGEGDVLVDTRVITTTKDNLEKSVMEGRFREDLFFRINVMGITIPPLRDRKEQILPLAQYFFDLYRRRYNRTVPFFSSRALQIFKEYHWPGNIRELENMVKRTILFSEEDAIQEITRNNTNKKIVPVSSHAPVANGSKGAENMDLKRVGREAAELAEKEVIEQTLQEMKWNRKAAAKLLKVSYKALLYKIQKYRLDEIKSL